MASTRRRARSATGRFLKKAFRRNPIRRRRAGSRRRGRTTIMVRNPIRRRRRARTMVAQRGRVRRFRRNPISGNLNVLSLILPAIGIGVGAIGAEIVTAYLPIPANFKTGSVRHLTKGAVGIAGGWALSKFANRKVGELFALGAMTIAAHDFIKDSLVQFMPNLNMAGYLPVNRGSPGIGYTSPGRPVMAAYVPRMAGAASDGYGMYTRMAGAASDGYSGRV